ncbi:hypothetical protein RFI_11957 [Reticulomyxa filosa]|uniref:Uncharacterized protein n=1 Tax=Reticulomyxa filosa TaxID=46433 RepID=X6NFT1_RETFI|nr:hypothetical protein RFI_11957 [Reticulomyxa filosa]|eukprot:ETO25180.1 hypothetical protein RFI_11957 [Reticulomyxa filosa]
MFHRVTKLDPIEMQGTYESNVPIAGIADVVVVGSDNEEINGYYSVVNIKYNQRYVYKSASQSYLYYVKYKGGETARWQIGLPGSGIQNDQPVAFVNSDVEAPEQIPTWVAWAVYDEQTKEWFRQPKIKTYKADCSAELFGAKNEQVNGRYTITPQTYNGRPVFERVKSEKHGGQLPIIVYWDETNGISGWFVSRPGRAAGEHPIESLAIIQSASLTPDGTSELETWHEWEDSAKDFLENTQFKFQGTCASYFILLFFFFFFLLFKYIKQINK